MTLRQSPEQIAEKRIAEWQLGPSNRVTWVISNNSKGKGVGAALLSLNGLGLKTFPESLRKLRELEFLDLSDNEIEEFPLWTGELSALKILALSGNKIRTLPPEIGSLRGLFILRLRTNQLETLPQTLTALPLEELDLRGNGKLQLPESLLSRPPGEVLRYYFESRDDKGLPLLELKLLLLGRGHAGKTTLVKRLANEMPDAHEPETPSISIRSLTITCPRGDVHTRAWDFGGQELLHSTHRFFLTERSLYLLVLEPRSGMAQQDAEYWLKLIETSGEGSPVIVIMNWSHGRRWRIDEVKLRRKFPFIVDFCATDALNGDGIVELREKIMDVVQERMRDVWVPFPKRWREIKDAVSGMTENYFTYSKYSEICARCGEHDPEAQGYVAGILNSLGLALYFGKDERLHDTRVLNPRWVTGGVYAVIRSPSVAENDGELTLEDMPHVLNEAEANGIIQANDYPAKTHRFILELMRAYELCYSNEELGSHHPLHYLVPELLPEFEPEMKDNWTASPLRLRYRFDVLQPGLLPRFIVRTHALSEGSPHWRHGVVLRHAEAKALVRAEISPPEIHVFVLNGDEETRRILISMVRRELESLHDDLKMQPVEELELTGDSEQWISVKALRQVERPDSPKQNLPVQPDGTAEIDVPRELDKLVPAEARAIDRDPARAPATVRLFVSYAHDDERQLKRLDAMLGVLEQHYGLTAWRDKRLIAGEKWDAEIRRRLETMDIFLFIASQNSLVRPYIKDPELRRAQERFKEGEIEFVTVKLEPCACDEDPFLGGLQRLASNYDSIAEASLKSAAWEKVRKDLLPVIKRVHEKRAPIIHTRG